MRQKPRDSFSWFEKLGEKRTRVHASYYKRDFHLRWKFTRSRIFLQRCANVGKYLSGSQRASRKSRPCGGVAAWHFHKSFSGIRYGRNHPAIDMLLVYAWRFADEVLNCIHSNQG